MKKILLVLLIATLLSGCGGSSGDPTPSDAEMATRVAQILTQMPAPTSAIEQAATLPPVVPEEPTLGVTVIANTPTEPPADTATLPPTETPLPTETLPPTEEPTVTGTVEPSPTPSKGDPRVALGDPTSTDPMDNAQKWNWYEGEDKFTKLRFFDGSLEFTSRDNVSGWRLPNVPAAQDIYIEMEVEPGKCAAKDNYGIIFHVPVRLEADRGYLFGISCDGQYNLWKWDGKAGEKGQRNMLVWWTTPKGDAKGALKSGEGKSNRIGVKVVGGKIGLYANGILLQEVNDNTYPSGSFGIFIDRETTEDFTIEIDEMSYWLLK
jgi:hypothetical protein